MGVAMKHMTDELIAALGTESEDRGQRVTEYQIVSAPSVHYLAELVNGAISRGWQPLGGVSGSLPGNAATNKPVYIQAIVKHG